MQRQKCIQHRENIKWLKNSLKSFATAGNFRVTGFDFNSMKSSIWSSYHKLLPASNGFNTGILWNSIRCITEQECFSFYQIDVQYEWKAVWYLHWQVVDCRHHGHIHRSSWSRNYFSRTNITQAQFIELWNVPGMKIAGIVIKTANGNKTSFLPTLYKWYFRMLWAVMFYLCYLFWSAVSK